MGPGVVIAVVPVGQGKPDVSGVVAVSWTLVFTSMVKIASGPGSPPMTGSAGTAVPPGAPKAPTEAKEPE